MTRCRSVSQCTFSQCYVTEIFDSWQYFVDEMSVRCHFSLPRWYSHVRLVDPQRLRLPRMILLWFVFLQYRQHDFGQRAFSYAAPAAWNSLPPTLQQMSNTDSFKKHLKHFCTSKLTLTSLSSPANFHGSLVRFYFGFIFLLVSLLTAGHFYVSGFIDWLTEHTLSRCLACPPGYFTAVWFSLRGICSLDEGNIPLRW